MKNSFGIYVAVLIAVVIVLNSSFFIVDQTQQAIVVRLGEALEGVRKPGANFKIPLMDQAIVFEQRLLDYDAAPAEILTRDKKNLVVDNFAKWQIEDPLKFYKTVRDEPGAASRLDDIIFAELRVELGRHLMIEIIKSKRSDIMKNVTERSNVKAKDYGIRVVDVRIKRADLPKENERAVYGRMRAEREREAKRYRAEGQEAALKLRADADREKTIILAEAYRLAQELRGHGDAESTRVYAEAYGQDPELFSFLRTLESYDKALDDKTTLILSKDDEFLDYFSRSGASLPKPIPAPPAKDVSETDSTEKAAAQPPAFPPVGEGTAGGAAPRGTETPAVN